MTLLDTRANALDEVAPVQFVAEQRDNAVLRGEFQLADTGHRQASACACQGSTTSSPWKAKSRTLRVTMVSP